MNGLPVSFTPEAAAELQRLQASLKPSEEQAIRVGIRGGGCSGASFLLGFDTVNNDDILYKYEGLNIAIHKAHSMYVAGMTIDFEDGLGFSFNQPGEVV